MILLTDSLVLVNRTKWANFDFGQGLVYFFKNIYIYIYDAKNFEQKTKLLHSRKDIMWYNVMC